MKKFRIGLEINKTTHFIKRAIDEKVIAQTDKSLTVPQAQLIGFIANHEEEGSLCQKDIEKVLGLKRSSVSLMLNNMEKNGYVVRLSDQNDARVKKVVLTEKAMLMREKIEIIIDSVNEKLSAGISEEEIEAFFKILSKMRENLQ